MGTQDLLLAPAAITSLRPCGIGIHACAQLSTVKVTVIGKHKFLM